MTLHSTSSEPHRRDMSVLIRLAPLIITTRHVRGDYAEALVAAERFYSHESSGKGCRVKQTSWQPE